MNRPFMWHKMPLQLVAAIATFISVVIWMPLIAWILWELVAPSWVWGMFGAVSTLEVLCWFVYHVVDSDGDDR